MKFKGRDLRVQKATEPKRREKKAERKVAELEARRERRKRLREQEEEDDEATKPMKNFGDMYSSDDSDVEKVKKRRAKKAEPEIKLEETSFGRKRTQAERDAETEIDLTNIHKVAKRKK